MNEEIINNINKRLDEAVEQGRRMVEEEDLAERVDQLQERTEFLIRKHPLKSMAAGILTGLIIGKIFSSED